MMLDKQPLLLIAVLTSFMLLSGCASTKNTTQSEVVSTQTVPVETAPVQTQSDETAVTSIESAPTAATAETGEEYRIGPQDLLEVQVFGVEELSQTVRVNSRGFISLPLIGQVKAAGLTSEELEKNIATALAKDYLQDPDVSIFIKEYTSQRITIEGAVNSPGIYPLRGQTTLLQAIAVAGGLGELAEPDDVKLFRALPNGQKKMLSFNLQEIRLGHVKDPLVKGSDIVVVQRSGSRSFLRDSLFRDVADLINPFRLF